MNMLFTRVNGPLIDVKWIIVLLIKSVAHSGVLRGVFWEHVARVTRLPSTPAITVQYE